MPRQPRLLIENAIYHVISRGVKQSIIFKEDDDRRDFLRLILSVRDEQPFILHSYCLMDNHYHLLLQPTTGSLSEIMHMINSVYANRYNKRHQTTGHVLQGRFHSIPVETDAYLATVSRYIHLNPVRAGMVSRPEDYLWSNYVAMVRGESDAWTDPQFVLGYFGADKTRQPVAYRSFVEDGLEKVELITDKVIWRKRQWGNMIAKSEKAALSQIVA